jgi:hypothetical protein
VGFRLREDDIIMTQIDKRTKELLEWADRFSRMQLHAEDVREPIRAHVARIVENICQQPDLSVLSDDQVRQMGADRAEMISQLDYLRVSAIAVTTTAKLEQSDEQAKAARKKGGRRTAKAMQDAAEMTRARVVSEAKRLRAAGVPEHRLVSEIMHSVHCSRGTVCKYLPEK